MEFDEDAEDGEDSEMPVMLGFARKPRSQACLLPQNFPSKVGGTPAWLHPDAVGADGLCGFCSAPLSLLLQVYAPDDSVETAFHRTIYLFCCPKQSCFVEHQRQQSLHPSGGPKSVKAFRFQLSRSNPFYSYYPHSEASELLPVPNAARLCSWCGTWRGEKRCGGCHRTAYCSRDHQVEHWKEGHSKACRAWQKGQKEQACQLDNTRGHQNENIEGRDEQMRGMEHVDTPGENSREPGPTVDVPGDCDMEFRSVAPALESVPLPQDSVRGRGGSAEAACPTLWPEYELVVEEEREAEEGEEEGERRPSAAPDEATRKLLEEYEARSRVEGEIEVQELQGLPEETSEGKLHWVDFQARIAKDPEQILRYCRSQLAKPLWPQLGGQVAAADIPLCASCQAHRTFEFQVLPQLLYFLKVGDGDDALDFSTIAVYTCSESCALRGAGGGNEGYAEELAWVQVGA